MKFYVAKKQGLFGAVQLCDWYRTEQEAIQAARELSTRLSYDNRFTFGSARYGERGQLIFSPV